jgi:hypothetical protein
MQLYSVINLRESPGTPFGTNATCPILITTRLVWRREPIDAAVAKATTT